MESNDLYAFFRDPNLIELIEQNKTTNNILDVIELLENQNSTLLAWCMNPNEGHGQSDAVIKDFLEAASIASDEAIWDNKKFFSRWTVGKIRTTSFCSAFITRELVVNCDGKNGRLDLFLVDPQNKLLIAIENKYGANLSSDQLEKYVLAVKKEIATRKVFVDFDLAFIVLDRWLGGYSEENLDKLGKRWALLDYSWLELSARRAQFQIERGNSSAQLLVAHCQKKTDWEGLVEKRISELAAELSESHPKVIQALRDASENHLLKWTPNALKGPKGELALFHAQHPEVCGHVKGVQDIVTIQRKLLKSATPELKADYFETGRTWFNAIPPVVLDLMHEIEDEWPIYINLYRQAVDPTNISPKFTLRLIWNRDKFDPEKCEEMLLRQHFLEDFPSLRKFDAAYNRRIVVKQNITQLSAAKEVKILLDQITKLIETRPSTKDRG